MDLSNASQQNLRFILEELSKKLNVANRIFMDEKHYDLNKYDDLKDLYEMVITRDQLSLAETDAFIDELRHIRNI